MYRFSLVIYCFPVLIGGLTPITKRKKSSITFLYGFELNLCRSFVKVSSWITLVYLEQKKKRLIQIKKAYIKKL